MPTPPSPETSSALHREWTEVTPLIITGLTWSKYLFTMIWKTVIVNVVISFKVQMLQILPCLSSKDYLTLPIFLSHCISKHPWQVCFIVILMKYYAWRSTLLDSLHSAYLSSFCCLHSRNLIADLCKQIQASSLTQSQPVHTSEKECS